jgi:hypothetical protein
VVINDREVGECTADIDADSVMSHYVISIPDLRVYQRISSSRNQYESANSTHPNMLLYTSM